MSDLIKREDAMGAVQDHFNANGFKGYDDGQKMMDRIKALPSAEATQNMRAWNGLYIKVYADDDPQDKAEKLYQICGDIAELAEVARCIQGYCDIPSAEAVQVVRCKECKHRDLFSCPLADNDFQKDDDFCSWGERKGGEEE